MIFISKNSKISKESIDLACRNFSLNPHVVPFITEDYIKYSAANYQLKKYTSVESILQDLNKYLSSAEDSGSPFIAFPELIGLAFYSVLPDFDKNIKILKNSTDDEELLNENFKQILEEKQELIFDLYFNVFSCLSKTYGIVIDAGSLYVIEDNKIYNRRFIFSETGSIITHQDKLILSPLERKFNISSGYKISVAKTRVGNIALLTSSCSRHYEPFAAAAALNCDIISSSASIFDNDIDLYQVRAMEQNFSIISAGINGGKDYGYNYKMPASFYSKEATPSNSCDTVIVTGRANTYKTNLDYFGFSLNQNIDFLNRLTSTNLEELI